jgi:hypothetical protein
MESGRAPDRIGSCVRGNRLCGEHKVSGSREKRNVRRRKEEWVGVMKAVVVAVKRAAEVRAVTHRQ